ncbi:MAG: hypothetical protein IPM61_10435 [Chlorobi bacterium]|nr:MAG: hypothetical protein UZ07_CHB004001593 [Chlorobi bacterium OLB7]MBK8911733.1 hypothetical protein [Chlorobiota bacterium]MBX7216524.1 hypothetical protein [Candidatus Kapabacteria bacterium]
MKRFFALLPALFACALLFSACEDSPADATVDGTLTATVDGTAFSATSSTVTARKSGGSSIIVSGDSGNGVSISLTFSATTTGPTVGTADYSAGPGADFAYTAPEAQINVTKLDDATVEGTFSFTATHSTGATKTVSNGSFSADFH